MQTEYFTTSLEHILAELERIDLLVQAQIMWRQQRHQFEDKFFRLVIKEKTINDKTWRPFGFSPGLLTSEPLSQIDIRTAFDHMSRKIWLQKTGSKRRGLRLRLDEIGNFFDLSPIEHDIFLICLAPEFDLHYERIYAYLQNDVTKKQPGINFVLDMLGPMLSTKQNHHKYLDAEAPLCKFNLLHFSCDHSYDKGLLPNKLLKVTEWALNYLLEVDIIDAELMYHIQSDNGKNGFKDLAFPAGLKQRLASTIPDKDVYRRKQVYNLHEPNGIEKKAEAAHLLTR